MSGPIDTDTTWSCSGSPYRLTGDITIAASATLAIMPGVTVNLNGYAIHVEGQFNAAETEIFVPDRSAIKIKKGGSANFTRVKAAIKDAIIVEAGGKVSISAPLKEEKDKPK